MRGLGILILVFGSVAVAFATYWFRRAASAGADAIQIMKETGSVTETARRLHAQERLPDNVRLSMHQKKFLEDHQAEFLEQCGEAIEAKTHSMMADIRLNLDRMPDHLRKSAPSEDDIQSWVLQQYAKEWCDRNGVR
jgi:hypothetical protein